MADEKLYPSIDKFYEIAKEEYTFQRNRLFKLEDKTKFFITLCTSAFTFEISNAGNVLFLPKDFNSFKNILLLCKDIMYFISITLTMLAIILLINIMLRLKGKIVNVVSFYNNGLYTLPVEDFVPYYTIKYLRSIYKTSRRINKLYQLLDYVIILSVISIGLFGFSYLSSYLL